MKWINIKDKLPDWDIPVLWCLESGYIFIDMIDHDNDWENFKITHEQVYYGELPDEVDCVDKITYWMPLPKHPQYEH